MADCMKRQNRKGRAQGVMVYELKCSDGCGMLAEHVMGAYYILKC